MNKGFSTYVKRDSFLHNFNPSLKLIILIFLVVMIFLPTGFFGQIIVFVILMIGWAFSRLPKRILWVILKSCFFMFIILFLINWMAYKAPGVAWDIENNGRALFGSHSSWSEFNGHYYVHGDLFGGNFYNGGTPIGWPIWSALENAGWQHTISWKFQGIEYAIFYKTHAYTLSSQTFIFSLNVSFKIFLMITVVTLIISSTNPVQLSFAIEDILSPLRIIKVPVNEWAMVISIALRFVPSLLEESQKIMNAQASRGVDFGNGNVRDKVKSLVSLIVPMFSIAFHKADDLAIAMEARNYNPRYLRTRYRSYAIAWQHWIVTSFILILFGFFLIFAIKSMFFAPFGKWETLLQLGSR